MILGVVGGLVFQLGEQGAGLGDVALEPEDAGPLQLHLAGGVAGFLGLLEGLEGLVEILAFEQGLAQIEVGQRPFGLLEVLDGVGEMAQEEVGDAELELPAFGRRRPWRPRPFS